MRRPLSWKHPTDREYISTSGVTARIYGNNVLCSMVIIWIWLRNCVLSRHCFFHLCPIKSYVSRDNATHPVPCKELPQAAYFVKINYSCSLYYGSQSVLVRNNITRRCIMHRQPAPDPGGSCTGSQLSIISWHLNLPLNLTLSLCLTITLD